MTSQSAVSPPGATNLRAESPPDGEVRLHVDQLAGISFPVPFAQVQEKTAAQVKALILEDPARQIPSGVQFTSGVYSQNPVGSPGLPYLLVWTKPLAEPWTRWSLMRLTRAPSASLVGEYGLGGLHFDRTLWRATSDAVVAGPNGLKVRVIVQLARSETVTVGLYYKDDADAALLEPVAQGLVLASEKQIDLSQLPLGSEVWSIVAAAALAALIATLGLVVVLRRRQGK